jgi:hypothetical protein
MWDFVMDKSGAGAGSENFGFPCQSTLHLLLHNHLHYHPRLAQVATVPVAPQTRIKKKCLNACIFLQNK